MEPRYHPELVKRFHEALKAGDQTSFDEVCRDVSKLSLPDAIVFSNEIAFGSGTIEQGLFNCGQLVGVLWRLEGRIEGSEG